MKKLVTTITMITALTLLVLEINHLLDTGNYDDVSIEDVEREIEDGTILRFLKEKAKEDVDLSILLQTDTYPGFEEFYVESLQQLLNAHGGDERRKWGIENLGLCLLLAWTNEIIQQGAGWYPSQ